MGIYEPTYRRFEGKTVGWKGRVFTIFKNEFSRRLRNKWVLGLLVISWALGVLPILVGAPFFAYFVFSFIRFVSRQMLRSYWFAADALSADVRG